MQVNLKVIGGKNDGRLIGISVPEFIIGRGEQAHLRPSSDLISRQHCIIRIDQGRVIVEDNGSRNGTFVNEVRLTGPCVAKVGDVLRVGRLQFELLIDHVQPGLKKPKVSNAVEAAARTAQTQKQLDDESITDWLTESPAKESNSGSLLFETRQFSLDDTRYRIETPHPENASDSSAEVAPAEASDDEESSGTGIFGRKKKEVKKLPERPKFTSNNTKDAAGEVLRRFFNQR